MATRRKEFQTTLNFNGKVDPSLRRATKTSCQLLNMVKGSFIGTGAALLLNKAKDVVIDFGKGMIEAASNLQETQGKISEVFKEKGSELEKWSDTATKTMGLSKQAALDSAALFGNMATGMSISRERAAQMAMTLTQLGADLASFNNISTDISQTALKGVFTGETESLKNLGVVMTQAYLQEFAYSIGIKKKIDKMKEAEKVELRYRYVLAKTKNAQGDYARTAQNAANAQRTFQQATVDLQAKIGENFLPYYAKMLNIINNWLKANSDSIVEFATKAAQGLAQVVHFCSDMYKGLMNVVSFIQSNAIPIMLGLGGAIATIVTMGTIDLIKYLGKTVMIASNEGIIAMTNWQRYLTVIKGIPAAIKAWTAATWANVMANRALKLAIAGTGIGLLIVGLSELVIHWKEIWSWICKCTDAVKDFFSAKNKGNEKQGITPERYTEMRAAPGHALGTNSFVGGSTWVGEHGPELVNLPRGSQILSNNRSMSGAGGNITMPVTININGNADANTMKNAAEEIMPNIKAQIDAYFREQRRRGVAFA